MTEFIHNDDTNFHLRKIHSGGREWYRLRGTTAITIKRRMKHEI